MSDPQSSSPLPRSARPDDEPLDALDMRILDHLQRDSDLTNLELAKKVHASPATCLRRVRRLKELGIIERQVALLDEEKLGAGLTAIIEITLDVQTAEWLDAFEARIRDVEEIQQCYRVSPGPDFILIARVADMPAYHELAHRVLTSQANVRNVRSFFSIHRSKFDTRIPLSALSASAGLKRR